MELKYYQKEALEFIKDKNHSALFLAPGFGKTFTTLKWLQEQEEKTVIVVTQASIIKSAWESSLKDFDYNLFKKTRKIEYNKVNLISFEMLKNINILPSSFILVIDESQNTKNRTTKRSKILLNLSFSPACKKTLLLSGTVIANCFSSLFVQMKILRIMPFNLNYNRWIKENFVWRPSPFNPYAIEVVKPLNADNMINLLKTKGFFWDKKEEEDEVKSNFIEVNLESPEIDRQFKNIVKKNLIDLKEDTIYLENSAQMYQAARLLSSGIIKKEDGTFLEIDNQKVETVKSIKKEKGRILIFYEFNAEKDILKKQFPESMEWNGTKKDDWTNANILLAQYKALSVGVDGLQNFFNTIIYFNLPTSAELFAQSRARIDRLGQRKDVFFYIFKATFFDNKIYRNIQKHKNYTKKMFENDFFGI